MTHAISHARKIENSCDSSHQKYLVDWIILSIDLLVIVFHQYKHYDDPRCSSCKAYIQSRKSFGILVQVQEFTAYIERQIQNYVDIHE